MHGRNRAEYKARLSNPKTGQALAKKAKTYHALSSQLLQLHRQQQEVNSQQETAAANDNDNLVVQLTEKLLTVNPDPNHLWNVRREALLRLTTPTTQDDKSNCSMFPVETERTLTATALERNPKAYGAWFHRKWTVRRFLLLNLDDNQAAAVEASAASPVLPLLNGELALTAKFLNLDARNFHCWNYRRFVVSALLSYHGCDNNDTGISFQQLQEDARFCTGAWHLHEDTHHHEHQHPNQNQQGNASLLFMGPQLAPACTHPQQENMDKNTATSHNNTPMSNTAIKDLLKTEHTFTYTKITQNFSNGSAFHCRSKLLPFLWHHGLVGYTSTPSQTEQQQQQQEEEAAEEATPSQSNINNNDKDDNYSVLLKLVKQELQLVKEAVFTEPDDQTPWWYHAFLLDWSHPQSSLLQPQSQPQSQSTAQETTGDIMKQQLEQYEELLQSEESTISELSQAEEGQSKWALLSLYQVLRRQMDVFAQLQELSRGDDDDDENEEEGEVVEEMKEEAMDCLRKLMEIDGDRKGRYQGLWKDLEKEGRGAKAM